VCDTRTDSGLCGQIPKPKAHLLEPEEGRGRRQRSIGRVLAVWSRVRFPDFRTRTSKAALRLGTGASDSERKSGLLSARNCSVSLVYLENIAMKRTSTLLASFLATSLILGGHAAAQSAHDQHRSGGVATKTAQANQMPGGGAMGPGTMGQEGMGRGNIGPGIMGQGGIGPGMMQGGMMQMMTANCPMMGNMMGGGDMPAFTDGRVAFLKAELGITDAQNGAWDAYAAALKKNLMGMHGMRETMITAMSATDPTKRLDAHLTAMESRVASLTEVKPALAKLYGVLTDVQKKKADQILTGMGCMM
jgi:hypothetical protein